MVNVLLVVYKTIGVARIVSRGSSGPEMEINLQATPQQNGLLASEDVLLQMQCWQAEGLRTVLTTLISLEGAAPRQPGAQMVIAEDGQHYGYLSGGCLEAAVVLEALAVLVSGRNKLVRFGRGSAYFDIKLPCGSGLDLYFDQSIGPSILSDLIGMRELRQTAQLRTDLATGVSTVRVANWHSPVALSGREGDVFTRTYTPRVGLLLLGSGPGLIGTALLAAALGLELRVTASDEATRAGLATSGYRGQWFDRVEAAELQTLDFATAALLFFHAHESEPDLLRHLLKSKCFYIGALGNHAVHRQRLSDLAEMGADPASLSRIRAPMGSIANAKSQTTLALGVLSEVMSDAKRLNLVP